MVIGSKMGAPVDVAKVKSLPSGGWLVKSIDRRVGGICCCSRSVDMLGRPSRVDETLRGRVLRSSRRVSNPVESGVRGDGDEPARESSESRRDNDGGFKSGENADSDELLDRPEVEDEDEDEEE